MGERLIGVRANDASLHEWLERLLAPVIEPETSAPPNLSVALGRPQSVTRQLHQLIRGGTAQLATSSLGRLLRAVPAELDTYAPAPEGMARLRARALVGPDDALLVDERLIGAIRRAEPRLVRNGVRVAQSPHSDVDVTKAELVRNDPVVRVDADVVAELNRAHPPVDRELDDDRHRIPIRAVIGLGDAAAGAEHPARRVGSLVPLVADPAGSLRAAQIDRLAQLVGAGLVTVESELGPRQLLDAFDSGD